MFFVWFFLRTVGPKIILQLKPIHLGVGTRPVTAMEVPLELKPIHLEAGTRPATTMGQPLRHGPMHLVTGIGRHIVDDIYFKKSVPIPVKGALRKRGGTGWGAEIRKSYKNAIPVRNI